MTDELQQQQALEDDAWRERAAALGYIVGGLAHEMNNIFGRILGFAELAIEEDVSPETRGFLTEVRDSTMQATKLTQWLGRFSRRRKLHRQATTAESLVDEAFELLRPEMKAEHVTLTKVASDDWSQTVAGDRLLLVQALVQMSIVRYEAGTNVSELRYTVELGQPTLVLKLSATGTVRDGGLTIAAPVVETTMSGDQTSVSGRLRPFGLLVPRAIAHFHRGTLEPVDDSLVLTLPLGENSSAE